MKSRKLLPTDYEQLCEWWIGWRWAVPPPTTMLSDLGVMISNDDVNICAGFLYLMNKETVGWFTFPVSNPTVRGIERKEGMKMLVKEIEKIAKENGVLHLYSALRNPSMISLQKENGYVANGGYTELIKNI